MIHEKLDLFRLKKHLAFIQKFEKLKSIEAAHGPDERPQSKLAPPRQNKGNKGQEQFSES